MRIVIAITLVLVSHALKAQLAEGKCKFLGNVIASSVPSSFDTYWNQVTPENAGKWESVEFTRDVMNWTQLDLSYQFAKTNGFPFKQHTFIWNNQKPSWLASLNNVQIKEEVEEWMTQYAQRYPQTDYVDVVNEPLNAPASYKNALGGDGATGYDWIIWSFQKARALLPNAKLLINEYNIINNNAATDRYLFIINLLRNRNLIDGIGVQGHYFELGNASASTLKANLDKLAETGLPIYISEFDVDLASDSEQRAKFEQLFPVLWEHPGVKGITLWGYIQGQVWLENAFLVRTNQSERPAMTWLKQYMSALGPEEGCTITSIEESYQDAIFVSPNPSGKGLVKITSPTPIDHVSIADLSGKNVFSERTASATDVTLNVQWPAGLYLVQVQSAGRRTVKKLVVE